MTSAKPASTPISPSKSAALARVLDLVPRGYTRYTAGKCPAGKAIRLARKLHDKYGIGCSPAQRLTRKQKGLANAALVMFWPTFPDAEMDPVQLPNEIPDQLPDQQPSEQMNWHPGQLPEKKLARMPGASFPAAGTEPEVFWILLVTAGSGAVVEEEKLASVLDSRRLVWLGYELVRHSTRGKACWTWRRTKKDMADLYAVLGEQLNRRQMTMVEQTLLRISHQPGFSGVREQSWVLCQFAKARGYPKELPFLFYVQKLSHGLPLRLS